MKTHDAGAVTAQRQPAAVQDKHTPAQAAEGKAAVRRDGMEREADVMGGKAVLQGVGMSLVGNRQDAISTSPPDDVAPIHRTASQVAIGQSPRMLVQRSALQAMFGTEGRVQNLIPNASSLRPLQRVVELIPGSNPQQYRSTLISDRVFASSAEANTAEGQHVAALQAERQRRVEQERQEQEQQREAQDMPWRQQHPQFGPPPSYFAPIASQVPSVLHYLRARELGQATAGQANAVAANLNVRRDFQQTMEELDGINPQLHRYAADPLGSLDDR